MVEFAFYDPKTNRAERIINLPPFNKEAFRKFRIYALKRALKENRAYVESAPGEMGKTYWQLRTVPVKPDEGRYETVSYITKETKNNVRAIEKEPDGKIITEFLTLKKNDKVAFQDDHFNLTPPLECRGFECDFSNLSPVSMQSGAIPEYIPQEHEGFQLARIQRSEDSLVLDYTRGGMVFLFIERPQNEGPLLIEPICRESVIAGQAVYLNYAGTYTSCRWRSAGKDRWMLTNLGPELALSYARKIIEATP